MSNFTAYAIISGLENCGMVSVRINGRPDGGSRRHPFPFCNTKLNHDTGEWELPRHWGGGTDAERIADFDADLADLGYRRTGDWAYDPTNRWATGYGTTIESI